MEKIMFQPFFLHANLEGTTGFLIRFGLNILSLIILIRFLYFRFRREGIPEYMFSFFLLGIIVFMICTALEMVDVQLGFALGLFALFGILRYRTESIPVREMTYLFLVIGISMINSLVNFIDPINGILLLNTLILLPTWIMEMFLTKSNIRKQELIYNVVEDAYLSEADLIVRLKQVTGLNIMKARVTKIDLKRHQVNIIIFYRY